MSTEADIQTSRIVVRRSMRSRLLLGLLGLCLVLWGIRAAYRSTLKTYDGRTMEEWFARSESTGYFPRDAESILAFQKMGTNGVWFLWEQYHRKDSEFATSTRSMMDRLTGRGGLFDHAKRRQMLAESFLCLMKPESDVLMPEILKRLRGDDADAATAMASLLISTRLKPADAVPGLIDSLSKTNRNAHDRTVHLWALTRYGQAARPALPALRTALASGITSNKIEIRTLHETILSIGGPGPELAYYTNRVVLGDYAQSSKVLPYLSELGTNARTAAPLLWQLSQSLTNAPHVDDVVEVIRRVDPEGVYAKP